MQSGKMFRVILLAPTIFRWLSDYWKFAVPCFNVITEKEQNESL